MYVIESKNVHRGLVSLARHLIGTGILDGEKDKEILSASESVTLVIEEPREQVVFTSFDDPFKRFASLFGAPAQTDKNVFQSLSSGVMNTTQFIPLVKGLPIPQVFGLELFAAAQNKTPGALCLVLGGVMMSKEMAEEFSGSSRRPYGDSGIKPFSPLVNGPLDAWGADLKGLMELGNKMIGFKDRFFRRVAGPMFHAWQAAKAENWSEARDHLKNCEAADWRLAAEEWINGKQGIITS